MRESDFRFSIVTCNQILRGVCQGATSTNFRSSTIMVQASALPLDISVREQHTADNRYSIAFGIPSQCDGRITHGDRWTCTFYDDDNPQSTSSNPPAGLGRVIVTKRIIGGGSAIPADFQLRLFNHLDRNGHFDRLNPDAVFPGQGHPGTTVYVRPGVPYDIGESSNHPNYDAVTASEGCSSRFTYMPGSNPIRAGETRYCTIYNVNTRTPHVPTSPISPISPTPPHSIWPVFPTPPIR